MKIGRNAPCPCGSGKKYKKCCLKKETKEEGTNTGMGHEALIKPESFYSSEKEKTKLNWFCYEVALSFHGALRDLADGLGLDGDLMANFATYLAREMKAVALQKLAGEIEAVYFSDEMVLSYLPGLADDAVDEVLEALSGAWDEQLGYCEVCPTRCITEKDAYCTMFDEGPY
jgi:hypothetical protein